MSFTTWLRKVNPTWDVVPASVLFAERSEKSKSDDVHLTPSQKLGVLPQDEYVERTGAQVVRNRLGAGNMKHVESGDFISHLRSFQGGLEFSALSGKVSNAYTVLSPRKPIVDRYYRYLFKSSLFVEGLGNLTDQLRDGQTINFARLAQFGLPLPDLETQRAIADYLDRETTEIDAMTADLDELEKLLTERRKAAVTAAFNKFSTTAPLWKFAKVSPSTPGIYDLDKGEDVTFIPLEDVWTNQKPEVFKVTPWKDKLASYTHFESGDVLLPKVTPTVTHGRAMVANVTTKLGVATSEVYTLRPNERTNPDWLAFFLTSQSFLDEAGVSVLGTGGLKRISTQFVQSFPVPDMSRSEQDELVRDIDCETAEIDAMLADIMELRDLLAERRAAVIAAAVTGQIDIPIAEEPTHA
ncbi:restriction endonuclease subunit S [Corynebacterium sp. ACRPH]|uniref:restriction endonuclease subunit S n=1 Tax=Corynebacterium sp. ACRPH TaxID=2918199 RepID=UPI001EF3D174|nr:restriction endonuclease subunit S [Corynebacterium sp. ACRPH]MCG7455685.1 restriction endonuclease subunit S [Corynebacterium sp. ACRPH]